MKADATSFLSRLEEGGLEFIVSDACRELLADTPNATLKDLAEAYGGGESSPAKFHAPRSERRDGAHRAD